MIDAPVGEPTNHRIVVGVDGSPKAARAMIAAAELAALLGAHIEAVFAYVMPAAYTPLPAVSAGELHDWARNALRGFVKEAFPDGPPTGTTYVAAPGSAAGVLLHRARDAAAVVVGSGGHGGVVNLLLGSVAAKVIEHAPCPVLAIRADTALDFSSDRRIVVGVDGSPSSKAALAWAHCIAMRTGAGIDAVMGWETPPVYSYSAMMRLPSEPSDDELERPLQDIVAEVFAVEQPENLRLFADRGYAADVLLDRARDAALLVVGSRGHGGFAGLLLGSVSASCVQRATCPVVVVHGGTDQSFVSDPEASATETADSTLAV